MRALGIVFTLPMVGLLACGGEPMDGSSRGKSDNPSNGQIVTIAFDGSRAISMWRESMAFAREMRRDQGKQVHFTYFINTPYYLTDPPRNALGISAGDISADEALRRWAYTQLAINEGHEIGSHLVGHYNGEGWSQEQWEQEFTMFEDHVRDHLFAPVLNSEGQPLFPRFSCDDPLATECDPVYPVLDTDGKELFDAQGKPNPEMIASGRLVPHRMVGLRAPELGWNNSMLDVMAARGFVYDTSQTGTLTWPDLTRGNLWEFPVQTFPRTRSSRSVLGMDYNFYVNKVDGAEVAEMYEKVVREAREGDRHPVYLCHHFSKWAGPDGMTYWDALKQSVRSLASLGDVSFPSYIELVDLLGR
jgi:hypothetical protein